ncbi:hypothetical protein [uncultured Mucilaginibacter sp.]|uniref:hypothetical protein n=1 Tax=uncultured Mucilaginibacter sp. TaxID=797541 RepID=UPI00260EE6D7|nr:hypothetical protein [uncultured Mucilaginibacter sp.]
METEVLFKETQRFRQWWLWLILIAAFGITISAITKEHKELQNDSNFALLTPLLVPILAFVLIFFSKLDTEIDAEGIHVRFFPFHFKFKTYSRDTIGQAVVTKYNPILDYGGWGLRLGLFGKGKAYNVSGNQGIQLVFKDGSKLLIGTQKPDEAGAALQKAGFLKAEMY